MKEISCATCMHDNKEVFGRCGHGLGGYKCLYSKEKLDVPEGYYKKRPDLNYFLWEPIEPKFCVEVSDKDLFI